MTGPLASAIMPISGKHSNALVHRARKLFSAQTYANKQLIELRLENVPLGELRNICIRQSMGSIIAHFDSDDWYHPEYLSHAVEALRHAEVCGAPVAYFLDDKANRAWKFDAHELKYAQTYRLGATLCYRRTAWERWPFDPYRNKGEDSVWQWGGFQSWPGEHRMVSDFWGDDLPPTHFVAHRHDGNTTELDTNSAAWSEADPDAVRKIMEATNG